MTTQVKLKILTTPSLLVTEEIQADIAKGHEITAALHEGDELSDFDLVLAPNAWRIRPDLLKYRELAYKECRAMRAVRKKGKT